MECKLLLPSSELELAESVEGLFDSLSVLPPQVHCHKCGGRLQHIHASLLSDRGKKWTITFPICANCVSRGSNSFVSMTN
jgi:hypothetical protein